MVHLRLNDPDTSRNKQINYITALPRYADSEQARHRLLQLAAQVQPVMKSHGFQINSLEEFEWNREFAGRNWNNGETVELVLRRQDGSFAPLQWVLMVFCHELAHIKYMNHIPSQHGKLDRELRNECRELQARGYYGDGFWSAGQRLQDNGFVAGDGLNSLQGLPEYSCGGAFRSKPTRRQGNKRRRTNAASAPRKRGFKGPSLHTGAQTAPNTKGGRRVQTSLPGSGSRVDGMNHLPKASAFDSAYKQDSNSTFRKRTQTASARELRAQAAMRRLNALKTEEAAVKPLTDQEPFWPGEKPDSVGSSARSSSFTNGDAQVKEEAGSSHGDSETETEDGEDTKDGGMVIHLDDSSEDESGAGSSASVTEREAEDGLAGSSRVKQEPDSHPHQTLASKESQEQRLERARLYRQHELQQGGAMRSTNEDWLDFCSIARLTNPSSIAQDSASRSASRSDPIEILSSDDESSPASKSARKATPRRPPRLDQTQSWSCQVCTLINSASALRCDACLTTKGSFLVGQ